MEEADDETDEEPKDLAEDKSEETDIKEPDSEGVLEPVPGMGTVVTEDGRS